jgi:hypothetical protein
MQMTLARATTGNRDVDALARGARTFDNRIE